MVIVRMRVWLMVRRGEFYRAGRRMVMGMVRSVVGVGLGCFGMTVVVMWMRIRVFVMLDGMGRGCLVVMLAMRFFGIVAGRSDRRMSIGLRQGRLAR